MCIDFRHSLFSPLQRRSCFAHDPTFLFPSQKMQKCAIWWTYDFNWRVYVSNARAPGMLRFKFHRMLRPSRDNNRHHVDCTQVKHKLLDLKWHAPVIVDTSIMLIQRCLIVSLFDRWPRSVTEDLPRKKQYRLISNYLCSNYGNAGLVSRYPK